MEGRLTLFRTRVARRVVLLFVLCALLPASALAFISYRSVRNQLLEESRTRLRDMAKNAGVAVAERFQFLESVARLNLVPLGRGEQASGAPREQMGLVASEVEEKFEAAILVQGERKEALFGEMSRPRDLTPGEEAHLLASAALVRIEPAPEGLPAVLLAIDMGPYGSPGVRLWTRLRGDYLWETASGYSTLPGTTGLCVFGGDSPPLFCTFPDADRFLSASRVTDEERLVDRTNTTTVFFDWEDREGTIYLAAVREVFLRPQFGIAGLTISVSESREKALSSMRVFQDTFLEVVLLSLLGVAGLSYVQIRKTLGPLEELKGATRRISRGQFQVKVEVDSGDEFEELAESFNSMGDQLDGQFRALGTMGDIDRAILSALDADRIVDTVLEKTGALLSCEILAVCRLHWLGSTEGRLRTHTPGSPGISPGRKHVLSADTLDTLKAAKGPFRVEESDRLQDLLGGEPGGEPFRSALVAPLHLADGLAGYFLIAGREGIASSATDSDHFRRVAEQLAVALSNARLLEELDRMSWGALTALARAIDAKSPWTMGHSERVTEFARTLGRGMGLPEESILNLQRGGMVHDIGKIGVPARILDSPNPLTPEEWEIIRRHPEDGVRILEPISAMEGILPIVLFHHESWDGSGYPMRLAGEAIPLEARVLAVADRFDAMTSKRPYRASLGLAEATRFIGEQAGRGLDPVAAKVFLEMLEEGRLPISRTLLEEGAT